MAVEYSWDDRLLRGSEAAQAIARLVIGVRVLLVEIQTLLGLADNNRDKHQIRIRSKERVLHQASLP